MVSAIQFPGLRSASEWYTTDEEDPCLDPAREAFDEALHYFSAHLTKDPKKAKLAGQATSIEDIQNAVSQAKAEYETRRKDSKAKEWLVKFSKRVGHYGNIFDVLVQHHPEYVSLAWGAMKLLFVGVVNHENLLASLTEALAQIAQALPHTKLVSVLYPSKIMKQAVAELYAYIIRFLIRAQGWYTENPIKRAVESFTRPAELRYKDIVDDIRRCSRSIKVLASAAAQAEQRDMHLELQEVRITLLEMRKIMIAHNAFSSSAHLRTNQQLSDIQLSMIDSFISKIPMLPFMKAFQHGLFMRNQRRLRQKETVKPFWLTPRFQHWRENGASSMIMVKTSFGNRFQIKDFCVNLIELLREANVPVLWALRVVDGEDTASDPTVIDIVKSLISQALRVNETLKTEQSMALSFARFQSAATEEEWFDILAMVLVGVPEVVLVVDIEILNTFVADITKGFYLPAAFFDLLQKLSNNDTKTIVRIVLVSYGSTAFSEVQKEELKDLVITIPKPRTTPKATLRPMLAFKNRGGASIMARARGGIFQLRKR